MIEVTTSVNEKNWKSFLNSCDDASIYHTPEWKLFLEKTFGYESHYLFVKDENDNITGMLPLFFIKSKLTGNRLCSVPFSHICGSVHSNDSKDLLITEGMNFFSKLNAKYFEIRDIVDSNGFHSQNSFSTYILKLSPHVDKTWHKLDKKSARWATKKSKKMGVQVDSTKNIDDLRIFYELNCITKKNIGVPCHPWKFFKNMFNLLNEYVSLYTVKYNNEIIAGGIFEYFNDTVLYGYGAADPDHLNLHPYNAFVWKSIEDACTNDFNYFDFGRTSYDNEGLINFKKKWGTVEKKLYYSYYPKNPESLTENRENFKYKYGIKAIQKMPIPIYKKFSDVVFGHFG